MRAFDMFEQFYLVEDSKTWLSISVTVELRSSRLSLAERFIFPQSKLFLVLDIIHVGDIKSSCFLKIVWLVDVT